MASVRQLNFAAGELAPSLYGRVDQARYASGLRTCRNFIVLKSGGIQNRPGSSFVGEVKDSSKTVRLLKYKFDTNQTYVLEFGHLYVRFHAQGGQILESSINITGISAGATTTVTAGNSYSAGDEVYISGLVGMPQLNNRNVKVHSPSGAAFQVRTLDGFDINSTAYDPWVSGGTSRRIYTLVSPYSEADLNALDIAQNKNTITIVHPSYAARNLTRTADASWTFSEVAFDSVLRPIFVGSSRGVVVGPIPIAGISVGNPAIVTTTAAHGLKNNDHIYISGITGGMATELNGFPFYVANVTAATPTTLSLRQENGTLLNSSTFPAYGANGVLVNLAHTRYKIVSVDSDTGEESQACRYSSSTITNISKASEALVTTDSPHNFFDGDEVLIHTPVNGGMPEVNNRRFRVKFNPLALDTTFFLSGEDSTNYTTFAGIMTASVEYIRINSGVIPDSETLPNTIVFQKQSSDIEQFNVYRADEDGIYGFIASINDFSGISRIFFKDPGYTADLSTQPPIAVFPFITANNYPSSISLYQQRLLLANTNNEPETVWASRIGAKTAFASSLSGTDDGPIKFTLLGKEVNRVLHMVDARELLIFSNNAEWAIKGNDAGILTPGGINARQQSYNGASQLKPIVIEGIPIYVQARESIVRDIAFNFEADRYSGVDLTVFSSHLVSGYQLVDWDYQQTPHSIVWMARSDGKLLGLTHIREHQIIGWHRHDTDGTYERVCVIPEGQQDFLYTVVKRTITGGNGSPRTARYIERSALQWKETDSILDASFLDSSLLYDGRNTTAQTMTLTEGTNWTTVEFFRITSSVAGYFGTGTIGNANLGNSIVLTGPSGDIIRCEITGIGAGGDYAQVHANRTIPVNMRNVAISSWSRAVDEIDGLWHLEGKQVCVFADGYVVTNPLNPVSTLLTVSGGSITLQNTYSVIRVGLPYASDIETLDIDTFQGETLTDKRKLITQVTLLVERSRGIWIGNEAPSADNEDGTLREEPSRDLEDYDDLPSLITGTVTVNIDADWTQSGRIFVRQRDPLPLTILSVIPSGLIPFR